MPRVLSVPCGPRHMRLSRALIAPMAGCIACILLTLSGARATQTPLAAPPYAVWPIPREGNVQSGRLLLTDAVIVVPAGDDPKLRAPGALLAQSIADEFGAVIPIVAGAAPTGRIPIYVGEIRTPLVQQV